MCLLTHVSCGMFGVTAQVTWDLKVRGSATGASRKMQHIQSSSNFQAALADGSVTCWGDPDAGVDSSKVLSEQVSLMCTEQVSRSSEGLAFRCAKK